MSEKEITGLRRFVEYGGFVIIDDASPESGSFDASVRPALARAFPSERLARLSAQHTIYRSFYLLDRPVGRVADPDYLEVIMHAGRAASSTAATTGGRLGTRRAGRCCLRDHSGGLAQREQSIRLGVNLVMYALCLRLQGRPSPRTFHLAAARGPSLSA